MPNVKPYPHYTIDVEDRSIYIPTNIDELPIHRPIYFMKTQKGIVGVPVWCDTYSQAAKYFGEETFNMYNTKYFSREAYFLNQTFQNNGAFIFRLVEESAKEAILIIEAKVKEELVTQYEKDIYGNRVIDAVTGEYVPLMVGGSPVQEDGISITWSKRTELLTIGGVLEDINDLQIRTYVDPIDGKTVTVYPMVAFNVTSPGAFGNDVCVSFYYNKNANDSTQVSRVGGLFYTLAPMQKRYGESTTTPIRDLYSNNFNSFIMKPDVIDTATEAPVSVLDVLEKAYTADYPLPYKVIPYSANFEILGDRARAFEPSLDTELTSGWLVNVVSGKDLQNRPYDHILVQSENIESQLNSSVVIYCNGGTDGAIDVNAMEVLMRKALALEINPDIVDKPRYPMTHLFDTGNSIDTKYAMLDFLNIRDDVKVYLSTQNCNLPMNAKMTDESTGSSLRSYALLMRESIVKGTEACRATIFQQCGYSLDNYKGLLPVVLWSAMKHAEYQNRDYMDREPKGLPYSDIAIFKEFNWIPSSDDTKSQSWDSGLNYCQYYTMKNLHFASIRTVYRYDTSVLVDDTFTDAIVYSKHEIRQSWAKFAGVAIPSAILQDSVEKDLTTRLTRLFNGKYVFTVTVYQTDEEKKLGYVQHVAIEITSPATNRVWTVDIVVKRENYEG